MTAVYHTLFVDVNPDDINTSVYLVPTVTIIKSPGKLVKNANNHDCNKIQ